MLLSLYDPLRPLDRSLSLSFALPVYLTSAEEV